MYALVLHIFARLLKQFYKIWTPFPPVSESIPISKRNNGLVLNALIPEIYEYSQSEQ
jgi:hypothetical protein